MATTDGKEISTDNGDETALALLRPSPGSAQVAELVHDVRIHNTGDHEPHTGTPATNIVLRQQEVGEPGQMGI